MHLLLTIPKEPGGFDRSLQIGIPIFDNWWILVRYNTSIVITMGRSSPYGSKKDGSFRACGDYRQLKDQTITDRYQVPRIEDFRKILPRKKFFSQIDLCKYYYQIPKAEVA